MNTSDCAFDDNGDPVPVAVNVESPELELITDLIEAGLIVEGPSMDVALAVVSAWRDRHGREHSQAQRALSFRDAADKILRIITGGGNASPLQAGRRAYCLQHKLKLGPCQLDRGLAARLRLPPSRIAEAMNEVCNSLSIANAREH